MEEDFEAGDQGARPIFRYVLGDVVYFFGEASDYFPQFYEPYLHFRASIFAIPGNHDGTLRDDSDSALAAFVRNLCFFFQAEDGIRDVAVTGVQTCALPICRCSTCTWWCCSWAWCVSAGSRACSRSRACWPSGRW